MEIEDLEIFVESVRLGSLTRAARALNVSQPTVSRRIQRLESELGQRLLDRRGQTVSPNRAGLIVLRFSEGVLARRRDLDRELHLLPNIEGDIAIAASTTPGEGLVPNLLAEFALLHPSVRPHLHVIDSQSVETCVLERHCDVGFMGRKPGPGLCCSFQVAEDEMCLAVAERHELAANGSVRPSDLLGLPFLERPPGSGTREIVEEILTRAGIPYGSRLVVAEMSSSHALLTAVAAGRGVSFVSRSLLGSASGVRGLAVEGIRLQRPIYLLHLHQRLPPPVDAFVRFVRSRVDNAGADRPSQSHL